jgi:hypothetical protein
MVHRCPQLFELQQASWHRAKVAHILLEVPLSRHIGKRSMRGHHRHQCQRWPDHRADLPRHMYWQSAMTAISFQILQAKPWETNV